MIVVWTRPGCGPCFALKRALSSKGIAFMERDAADADPVTLADWRAKGFQTPVVEHAGGTFSGFVPAKVQALIDAKR